MFVMPSEVKIAGYMYDVSICSPVYSDGKPCYGDCNFEEKTIRLDNTSPKLLEETFIHELLHSIIFEYGLNSINDVDEETAIRVLSKGLVQVLKDNNLEIRNTLKREVTRVDSLD